MESGATAWEVREMAKSIGYFGAEIPAKASVSERYGTRVFMKHTSSMERAVLVEALGLLAAKKEAERGR